MDKENQSKAWIGCVSAAAIIIAAIIGLGMPFAENMAARLLPPYTPTAISVAPTEVSPTIIPQQTIQPTSAPVQPQSTSLTLCYGHCWQFDDSNRTMTWTRLADGTEDVWQPAGDELENIRNGYTAVFTTTVPGEIFACILTINGEAVKSSCDGVLYQVPPGTYQVTSASSSIGGFRWCPLVGYGWRANGGECK